MTALAQLNHQHSWNTEWRKVRDTEIGKLLGDKLVMVCTTCDSLLSNKLEVVP